MVTAAPRAKVDVKLAHDQRSDTAAGTVLRALLEVVAGNLEGAVLGQDDEFLHQLRVAVRRSRTVQRQLRGVFPPLLLPGYRSEFRWLQQATGDARDLDVYVAGFDELRELLPKGSRADLEPLRMVLGHARLAARGETARALLSRRTTELIADWEMLLETLVELPTEDRPDALVPIGELAGRRLRRVYERVVRIGSRIGPSSSPVAVHELRKKAKELRYLIELFGVPLFSEEALTPLVKSLKSVQDVLGRHQDREVQTDMLRSLADEVATLPGGPRAVLAMGILVDRLAGDKLAARREFGEVFATLASPEQRELVARTFE